MLPMHLSPRLSLASRSIPQPATGPRGNARQICYCRSGHGRWHKPGRQQPAKTSNRPADSVRRRAATPGQESTGASPPFFGGNGGDASGFKKTGTGGEGDGSYDPTPLLLAAGKSLEDLPAELAKALREGRLPRDVLERFLKLQNSLLGPLLNIGGFRERLLADPGFFVKVGIEVGIGICAKTSAEYTKRGENFSNELDFVLANVIMALVADFMLVWLPAPTFSSAPRAVGLKQNAVSRFFASCPDNAFQKVPSGYAPFSPQQRVGAMLRNGGKLLGVGFGASLFGVGVTNALVTARQMLDSSFVPQNPPQDVLRMSAAYASYMAISSNLRYQVIAGLVEERGFEALFRHNQALCGSLSLVTRTANTFLGSLWWVDYLRLLGLQKAPGSH